MIQKMKKITLLAMESRKQMMLEQLADLSVMHISFCNDVNNKGNIAEYNALLEKISKMEFLLQEHKSSKEKQISLPPQECLDLLQKILEETDSAKKQLDELLPKKDLLSHWGDFDFNSIREMKNHGVFLKFWKAAKKNPPESRNDLIVKMISSDSASLYLISVSRDPEAGIYGGTEIRLPEISYGELCAQTESLRNKIAEGNARLAALASNRESLKEYAEQIRNKLDFAKAELTARSEEEITLLSGYIPEIRMEDFSAAARKNGWAYLAEPPAPDDPQVPTYITKPEWLGIMDPLFDLIGIDPGYRENDVNAFFFLFFPIFFGLIIGDAGYGVLFLTTALICKRLLRKRENAKMPLNLFLYLSCFSLGWGWLSGNWFGIPQEHLPEFMRGWSFLSDPQNSPLARKLVLATGLLKDGMSDAQINGMWNDLNNRIVQWLCFFLAALHLTSARIFKFIVGFKSSWRAWGNLGWALLLTANFLTAVNLIVFPGTFPKTFGISAYIAGVLLVAVTTEKQDFLNLPFSLIGSFTDILSYIRLFAVGLAGTCIAVNFNNMGGMLIEGTSGIRYVLAFLAMTAIILFGHALNIALSFLSVLAHGVRLNTLEFSGHMGMQWSGIRYKPFTKLKQKHNLENNKENKK